MSRSSEAANAVIKAVEDVCGLYRVPVMRMQSRAFTVQGAGGRDRPFFTGQWRDLQGALHRGGMADLLAMPRICGPTPVEENSAIIYFTVPLWIECKAGSGRMEPEQVAFQQMVEGCGAFHLVARDSADAVLAWFKERGVRR